MRRRVLHGAFANRVVASQRDTVRRPAGDQLDMRRHSIAAPAMAPSGRTALDALRMSPVAFSSGTEPRPIARSALPLASMAGGTPVEISVLVEQERLPRGPTADTDQGGGVQSVQSGLHRLHLVPESFRNVPSTRVLPDVGIAEQDARRPDTQAGSTQLSAPLSPPNRSRSASPTPVILVTAADTDDQLRRGGAVSQQRPAESPRQSPVPLPPEHFRNDTSSSGASSASQTSSLGVHRQPDAERIPAARSSIRPPPEFTSPPSQRQRKQSVQMLSPPWMKANSVRRSSEPAVSPLAGRALTSCPLCGDMRAAAVMTQHVGECLRSRRQTAQPLVCSRCKSNVASMPESEQLPHIMTCMRRRGSRQLVMPSTAPSEAHEQLTPQRLFAGMPYDVSCGAYAHVVDERGVEHSVAILGTSHGAYLMTVAASECSGLVRVIPRVFTWMLCVDELGMLIAADTKHHQLYSYSLSALYQLSQQKKIHCTRAGARSAPVREGH